MDAVVDAVVELRRVRFVRDGVVILDDVDWVVRPGERWVVLGPNGSGKTSLLRIAALWEHPSSGTVRVLGEVLGRTDVRRLRARVGYASIALADLLRSSLAALDIVVTAAHAALEPWWHRYTDADRRRAAALLAEVGAAHVADHAFGTLSAGERQRVLLARAFAGEPGVVLLDEPTAGLDLGAREDLVTRLGSLASSPTAPPVALVTHHVDEIPAGFTHALLLAGGRAVAAGPLHAVLTEQALTELFGLPLHLERRDGRWFAWARRGPASADQRQQARA